MDLHREISPLLIMPVQAHKLALVTTEKSALNQIYNVAGGEQLSFNEMIESLQEISSKNIISNYGLERKGDVKHSKAYISKISNLLGYKPQVKFR